MGMRVTCLKVTSDFDRQAVITISERYTGSVADLRDLPGDMRVALFKWLEDHE